MQISTPAMAETCASTLSSTFAPLSPRQWSSASASEPMCSEEPSGWNGTPSVSSSGCASAGIRKPVLSRLPVAASWRNCASSSTVMSCHRKVCAGWSGTPCFLEIASAAAKSGSSLGGSPPTARNSASHHSLHQPPGTRVWLFSRNSPGEISTSPTSTISRMRGATASAASRLLRRTQLPSSSSTSGPSIESHGVTAAALPGSCILSWVPMAVKLSSATIVAGFNATAASPVRRVRP